MTVLFTFMQGLSLPKGHVIFPLNFTQMRVYVLMICGCCTGLSVDFFGIVIYKFLEGHSIPQHYMNNFTIN